MINRMLGVVFILALCFTAQAQVPEWYQKLKQVKPLQSTRGDVERIFDSLTVKTNFVDEGVEAVFYETSEGKLSVYYSADECTSEIRRKEETDSGTIKGYKTEKGTVIYAIFFPKVRIKLSKLRIDKNSLLKSKDGDNPAWDYSDDKTGIEYTVQGEKVNNVELYPSSISNYLMCENKKSVKKKVE